MVARIWRGAWLLGLVVACGSDLSAPVMTAERCQAEPGFVFVAGGEFQVGSDRNQRDYGYEISASTPAAEARLRQRRWFEGEAPAQVVELPGFCLSQTLVTQAEYQAFVQATGHRAPFISEADYQRQGFLVHPYSAVRPYLWQPDSPPDRLDHPVVLVSLADAEAYARWRSGPGHTYRLPTALEWEKAARGEDGRYFPWGSTWQGEATNWGGSGLDGTSAVGTFADTGPYGTQDMAGNVFEYTSTRTARGEVVMKGCSWDDLPGFCRGAYRHGRPSESRHILFGFRLVLE